MTKQEAIIKGVDLIKGRDLKPGTICAIKGEERTHELVRYDGINAIVELDGEEKRWLRTEVFDANKLRNVAQHLLSVGFWREGMEGFIVDLQPNPQIPTP